MSIIYRGSYNIRNLENDDFGALNEIIDATPGGGAGYYRAIFGQFSLPSIKDFNLLSIIAEERTPNGNDKGPIKGLLCMNDGISCMNEHQSFNKVIELLNHFIPVTINNTLFVSFWIIDEYSKAPTHLIQEAFAHFPHIDYILWVTPLNFVTCRAVDDLFSLIYLNDIEDEAIVEQVKSVFKGLKVFFAHRSKALPKLAVRKARVEDNDDLIPIIQKTHADILNNPDHYILADLILKQDAQNAFYVGLENDNIRGMLSTSLDVNMSLIMKIFDIDAYPDLIIQTDAIPPPPPLFIAMVGDIRLLDQSALESSLLDHHCLYINFQKVEAQYRAYIANGNHAIHTGRDASYVDELTLSNPFVSYVYYNFLLTSNMDAEAIQAVVIWGFPHNEDDINNHQHTLTYEFDYILELYDEFDEQDDDEDEFLQFHLDCLEYLKEWYFRDDLPPFATGNYPSHNPNKHYQKSKASWKKLAYTKDVILIENVSRIMVTFQDCFEERVSRLEAAKILNKEKPPKANAFAITALCVEEEFASRSVDLIRLAFEEQPSIDYCLYMVSNNDESLSLSASLRTFNYVKPRPGVSFDQSLFILHRVYFKTRENLSLARIDQSLLEDQIYSYLQYIPQKEQQEVLKNIQYSITENDIAIAENPQDISFAIKIGSRKVIGLVVMSKRMLSREDISWYRTYYHVDNYINYEMHRMSTQYAILHWYIDPIFSTWTRFLLQQVLRICHKSVLYYHLDRENTNLLAPPKEIMEQFLFVCPQRTPEGDHIPFKSRPVLRETKTKDGEAAGAVITVPNHSSPLFVLTKSSVFHWKEIVTKRMVIVGGSTHSYAYLETFCSMPDIYYPNIYFVAEVLPMPMLSYPDSTEVNEVLLGLTGEKSTSEDYCGAMSLQDVDFPYANELSAMGYNFRINVIKGRLTDIDRENRAVVISDELVIEYDYMLISSWTQDNSHRQVASLQGVHPSKCADAGIFMLGNPAADILALNFIKKRSINRTEPVVLCGLATKVFTAAASLLAAGVDASKIVCVLHDADDNIDGGMEVMLGTLFMQGPSFAGIKFFYWKSTIAEISLSRNGFLQTVELKELLTKEEQMMNNQNNIPSSSSATSGKTSSNESKEQYNNNQKAVADSMSLNGPIRINCIALCFCAGQEQQSCERDIFAAINDCGLVFDGGLIVNLDFQTVDPHIYAVSDYTKFSRVFKGELPHNKYNGKELGSHVAINIISSHFLPPSHAPLKILTGPQTNTKAMIEESKRLMSDEARSSTANTSSSSANKKKKLQFVLPRSYRGALPGGLYYFHTELPKFASDLHTYLTDNVHIQTHMSNPPPRRILSLKTDAMGTVAAMTYVGLDGTIECRNLALLPGKHETSLNNSVYNYRKGFIDDWIEYFRSKWCAIIYLNHFPLFLAALKKNAAHEKGIVLLLNRIFERAEHVSDYGELNEYRRTLLGGNGELLLDTTRRILEQDTIDYIQKHREFMPQFYVK